MAHIRSVLCLVLASSVSAVPVLLHSDTALVHRQDGNISSDGPLSYSLPGNDPLLSKSRAAAIETKRNTFLYGPPLDVGPSYPTGPLGLTYVAVDTAITDSELGLQELISNNDSAIAKTRTYNGLQTLDDYVSLYDGEWVGSSRPTGIDPGILQNYTQDLLFSMERLSFNPFAIRRLDPDVDSLPFSVDNSTSLAVAGQTLSDLFAARRLFYADHRNQSSLPRTDKYAAACDAYFYINSSSSDFLPLAIRTNVGSNLIYTPADSFNDWLLAKMMFNANDFFMGQFDHFPRNHFTAEAMYEAAVRSLSDDHPVLAILKRLMYGAFGIRPLASLILFPKGADVDTYFGYTGSGAAQFSNDTYFNGYAGAVQANYFRKNLERRGLINSKGPALKSFPFYEDAAPIFDSIRDFTGSFINSYYTNDSAVRADTELQAFVNEATGPAGVIDFPSSFSKTTLADYLAEVAQHVSISHHAVNLNQLLTGSSTLPLNPTAFYKPLPTSKGVTNVASFLPPLKQCLGLIDVAANFARPLIAGSNRTIANMFDDAIMLARMNTATQAANSKFKAAMLTRSQIVKSRGFDANGLSQGMPFVWKALDPDVAAWSLTI